MTSIYSSSSILVRSDADDHPDGNDAAVSRKRVANKIRGLVNSFETQTLLNQQRFIDSSRMRMNGTLSQFDEVVDKSIDAIDESVELTLMEASRQNAGDSALRDCTVDGLFIMFCLFVWLAAFDYYLITEALRAVESSRADYALRLDSAMILVVSILTGAAIWAAARYAFRPGWHALDTSERRSKIAGSLVLLILIAAVLAQFQVANRTHFSSGEGLWDFSRETWTLYGFAVLGLQFLGIALTALKLNKLFTPVPGLMANWSRAVREQGAIVRKTVKKSSRDLEQETNDVHCIFEDALKHRSLWLRQAVATSKTAERINSRTDCGYKELDTTKLSRCIAAFDQQECRDVPVIEIERIHREASNQLDRLHSKFERATLPSALVPVDGQGSEV